MQKGLFIVNSTKDLSECDTYTIVGLHAFNAKGINRRKEDVLHTSYFIYFFPSPFFLYPSISYLLLDLLTLVHSERKLRLFSLDLVFSIPQQSVNSYC